MRKVCRELIVLCRRLEFFSEAVAVIDGSKFKAVNGRDRNDTQAKLKRRLEDALHKLGKYPVLILDDFGYVKKSTQETQVLFELIAHRYERASLIITSNQPFAEWERIFPDPVMTVAAVDRLVHHATIIEVVSDSYRRKQALGRLAEDGASSTAPAAAARKATAEASLLASDARRRNASAPDDN
jgi:Cdc6-like AAA superfamily ATPase